jgi:hypothetical protein
VALPGEPSGSVGQLRDQAGASAIPHFSGEFPHGLPSDNAAVTAGKGSPGVIKGRQKLYAPAFALFPQRKCLLYRFFLAVQPPAFNGEAGGCLLICRKPIFHCDGSYSHRTPKEAAKEVRDFRNGMAGNGFRVAGLRILPKRVFRALPPPHAAMPAGMPEQSLARLTLPIGAKHFSAVGDIPWAVSLDDRR